MVGLPMDHTEKIDEKHLVEPFANLIRADLLGDGIVSPVGLTAPDNNELISFEVDDGLSTELQQLRQTSTTSNDESGSPEIDLPTATKKPHRHYKKRSETLALQKTGIIGQPLLIPDRNRISSDSILFQTLSQLFGKESDKHDRSCRCFSTIPMTDEDRLRLQTSIGIMPEGSVEILSSITIGLIAQSGITDECYQSIITNAYGSLDNLDLIEKTLSCTPIISPEEIQDIRNVGLIIFPLPCKITQILHSRGINNWMDACGISEQDIIKKHGATLCAFSTIWAIWELKSYIMSAVRYISTHLPDDANSSYETYLNFYLYNIFKPFANNKKVSVVKMRYGLVDGRFRAFQEVGDIHNVSKECISQINKKMARGMERQQDDKHLRDSIEILLRWHYGILEITRLSKELAELWGWADEPDKDALLNFIKLLSCFRIQQFQDITIVCLKSFPCINCRNIGERLETLLSNSNGLLTCDHLAGALAQECCKFTKHMKDISNGFLRYLIDKKNLLYDNTGTIYSPKQWNLRVGPIDDAINQILFDAKHEMHFQDLYTQLRKTHHTSLNSIDIRKHLNLSPNTLLWGQGSYIHKAHVSSPHKLFREIKEYINSQKESGLPYISAKGIFDIYAKRLHRAGITNMHAFYSILKEDADERFHFSRFPYIHFSESGSKHIPIPFLLEVLIKDADEGISISEIESFIANELHTYGLSLHYFLARTPNIIQSHRGTYLHIDNCLITKNQVEQSGSHDGEDRHCLCTAADSAPPLHAEQVEDR